MTMFQTTSTQMCDQAVGSWGFRLAAKPGILLGLTRPFGAGSIFIGPAGGTDAAGFFDPMT